MSADLWAGSCYQAWDAEKKAWKDTSPTEIPGAVRFVELDVPESLWSTTTPLNFTDPQRTDLIASRLRISSEWYPGGNQWDTNYPIEQVVAADRIPPGRVGAGLGSTSQIQVNPANQLATTLLQNQQAIDSKVSLLVNDYSAYAFTRRDGRTNACLA